MAAKYVLIVLLWSLVTTLVVSVSETGRRRLPGDRTLINSLLGSIAFNFPTDVIEDQNIRQSFRGGHVDLEIVVGGGPGDPKQDGVCNEFEIVDSPPAEEDKGDITIVGVPTGKQFFQGRLVDAYDITISAKNLKFACTILMKITIKDVKFIGININLGGIQDKDPGNIKFTSSSVGFSQTFTVYSEDFATKPPFGYSIPPDSCDFFAEDLNFDPNEVLSLFDNDVIPGVTINLDGPVENALEKNQALVTEPAREKLCEVFAGLAEQIGELLIGNALLSTGDDALLIVDQFRDENNDGKIAALEKENNLTLTTPQCANKELLNFQKGNFLVDIFFPKGGEEEENLLDGFFDSVTLPGNSTLSQADATNLVLFLLNDTFPGLDVDPNLQNVDLLEIVNVIRGLDEGTPVVLVNDSFVSDFGNVTISLFTNEMNLTQISKPTEGIALLNQVEIIGKHTLLLPGLGFGDFGLDSRWELSLSVDSEGFDFMPPFSFQIDEVFFLNAIWNDFTGSVAGLMAVDEEALFDIQIGPLLDTALDCILSTLCTPSVIVGASVTTTGISGELTGFVDFITNLAGQVGNTLLFAYQAVAARGLETLLAGRLNNLTMFEIRSCPTVVQDPNSTLYNFSTGIFATITDLVDAEFVESVFDFAISPSGNTDELSLVNNPLEFDFDVFPINGWSQTVFINIFKVSIGGLVPPTVNSASMDVPKSSPNFPQGIVFDGSFGEQSNRISVILGLEINLSDPFEKNSTLFPNLIPSAVPPSILKNASNTIELTLAVADVATALEVFAHLTQYSVDSMTIGDAIVIDCWVAELLFPGGWYSVEARVNDLVVNMTCDCETPILNALETSINSPRGWSELTDVINELVDLFESFFVEKFNNIDNFEFYVENARRGCAGLPKLDAEIREFSPVEPENSAYTIIAMIGASLGFTIPFSICGACSRKRKSQATNLAAVLDSEGEDQTPAAAAAAAAAAPVLADDIPEQDPRTLETTAMFRNRLIPTRVRILIPVVLASNLGMFIYGDLGVAIIIGLDGSLFGAPLQLLDFAQFSVITSTVDLYQSGAYGLAILITVLVLVWPYLKLLGMSVCFFLPPSRLNLKRRGQLLHFMDAFGKWSMIEIFFVIFLRLTFELSVGSGDNSFLPSGDLYFIELLITPQIGLYTFALAVVLSIVLSNILVWYHEEIIRINEQQIVDMIKNKNPDMYVKHKMSEWEFSVTPAAGPKYGYSLTPRGILTVKVCTGVIFLFTIFAFSMPVVHVEYVGLAALLLRLEGTDPLTKYSIVSLANNVIVEAFEEADVGALFLTLVIVFATVLVPLAVLAQTYAMVFRGHSVNGARRFKTFRVITRAWTSLEVVALAVAVAVIEVPVIASYIVSDSCDFIEAFMQDTLFNLGLVTEEDLRAVCFGVNVDFEYGIYFLVICVLFTTALGVTVTRMFSSFIKQRRSDINSKPVFYREADTPGASHYTAPLEKLQVSSTHSTFKRLGLIKVFRVVDESY